MMVLDVLSVVFSYLLIGMLVANLMAGRDPLDFAGWPVVLTWPLFLIALIATWPWWLALRLYNRGE